MTLDEIFKSSRVVVIEGDDFELALSKTQKLQLEFIDFYNKKTEKQKAMLKDPIFTKLIDAGIDLSNYNEAEILKIVTLDELVEMEEKFKDYGVRTEEFYKGVSKFIAKKTLEEKTKELQAYLKSKEVVLSVKDVEIKILDAIYDVLEEEFVTP